MKEIPEEQHNVEIQQNLKYWQSKPILQKIYKQFYLQLASYINLNKTGKIVELGSGIGNMKSVVPQCISTDIFPNPWLDQVENAYQLSFTNGEVSHLILFDVFHHLEFPGTAFDEFDRVLNQGGRVILIEPCISWLGRIVYGLLHHEPIGYKDDITWKAHSKFDPANNSYYAAQGNATRIFVKKESLNHLTNWKIVEIKRFSALAYVGSGGYSKPQMYPNFMYGMIKGIEKICDLFPTLFATRLVVVLEKN